MRDDLIIPREFVIRNHKSHVKDRVRQVFLPFFLFSRIKTNQKVFERGTKIDCGKKLAIKFIQLAIKSSREFELLHLQASTLIKLTRKNGRKCGSSSSALFQFLPTIICHTSLSCYFPDCQSTPLSLHLICEEAPITIQLFCLSRAAMIVWRLLFFFFSLLTGRKRKKQNQQTSPIL